MGFGVNRQRIKEDNCLYVEIACGKKNVSPDILTPRYKDSGEGKYLIDPRDAVNIAERIYKLWDRDYWDEKKRIRIVEGKNQVKLFDFDKKGLEAAKNWAEKTAQVLDKCGHCAKLIGAREPFGIDEIPNLLFCSDYCLCTKYNAMFGVELQKSIKK